MKLTKGKWKYYGLNEQITQGSLSEFIEWLTSQSMEYQYEHEEYDALHIDRIYVQCTYEQDIKLVVVWDSSRLEVDFPTILCCFESSDDIDFQTPGSPVKKFQNLLTGNCGLIMQAIQMNNKAKIRMADVMLKETKSRVKLTYDVVTENKNLKKIEFDIAKNDATLLADKDREYPLSSGIMSYIYSKTGMHCDRIPLFEIKLQETITICSEHLVLHRSMDFDVIICILFDSINI